jgi:cellulose synthase/poly-beta-1,6-N-acetylglucosamine synthase-like glycosyltransferase
LKKVIGINYSSLIKLISLSKTSLSHNLAFVIKKIMNNKKINQPKVSVIIVAYNAEGMKSIFKQCLDSALNLKYNNYEVIVVNNGSTDKTREILENYEKDLKIINLKRIMDLLARVI